MPDRDRFREVIGGVIDDAPASGFRKVRGFGEMVDILRRTNLTATFRLEELWNELLVERGIALLCGYSLDAFDPKIYRGLFQHVSGSHSTSFPSRTMRGWRTRWAARTRRCSGAAETPAICAAHSCSTTRGPRRCPTRRRR